MASGEDNSSNDPNRSFSTTVGRSGSLSDPSFLTEKNFSDSPTKSQDLHSSPPLQPVYEIESKPLAPLEPKNLWNVPERPHPPTPASPENISSKVQETQLSSNKRDEAQFSGNEDAVLHIPSGMDFNATQNSDSLRQDLYVQQASKIECSKLPIIQGYGSVSKENPQFLWQDLSENRCEAIQQRHAETELGVTEFSVTRSSEPPAYQFAERSMNRPQGYDSLTCSQPCNEPSESQSSYLLSHQPPQSVSNIGQTAHPTSHEVFRNNPVESSGESSSVQDLSLQSSQHSVCGSEDIKLVKSEDIHIGETEHPMSSEAVRTKCMAHQSRNLPSCFHHKDESSGTFDLSSESFKNPTCRSKDVQNVFWQGHQQSESNLRMARKRNSSGHQSSGINFIQDCRLNEPNKEIRNQSIAEQDLHSPNKQKVDSKIHETDRFHLSETLTENTTKRQLLHSHPEQQFKRESRAIPLAESQSSTLDSGSLPGSCLEMDSFINKEQDTSSNEASVKVEEYVDLRRLQHPYSNRCEHINIFVCGDAKWTNSLLQTFEGSIPLDLSSPHKFAFVRSITRCGISMSVSVWKINDWNENIGSLASYYVSSRSTIVCVDNITDRLDVLAALLKRQITPEIQHSVRNQLASKLEILTNLIPRNFGRNVPIILVLSKFSEGILGNKSESFYRNIFDLNDIGFRLKAKHDISAYMECSVDSAEEVEAVMFTAIDVSFLWR